MNADRRADATLEHVHLAALSKMVAAGVRRTRLADIRLPAGAVLAVHDRLLQELRNLRDAFAPDEEIRASAARLRLHKNMVMPVTAEHHAIAVDAGLLFDELTERYNALVFPSRGFQSAVKKAN